MIELRETTKEDYNDVIDLEVYDYQRSFAAPNIYTLAQAYAYRDIVKVFSIYNDDTLVGLAMLDLDKDKSHFWVWRMMIDKEYQQKGYGYEALMRIFAFFREEGATAIKISFEEGNDVAEKLYTKAGFKRTGDLYEGEIEMIAQIV